MEFRPTFEDSEPKHRSMPRLAAEDGSIAVEDAAPPAVMEDEDEDDASASSQADSHELDGPAWQGWVFALTPLLAALLGAATAPWARGLAALLLGGVMLAFPVRRRLPRVAFIALAGAVLAPLLAFLPQSFHGAMPWREMLEKDWGLQLGNFVTPQPWVSFESWVYASICLLWLGWCMGRGFSQAQRGAIVRALAAGGIILCWLSIIEGLKLLPMPWWPRSGSGEGFGPFPNRNITSGLAAVTCVLCAASAYDANRRKQRSWMFYAAGFFLPATAIFMNSSRAGLLLLFLGMTLWLGFSAMRRGFFKKMAVTASIALLLATVIFVSRGGLSGRLLTAGSGAGSSAEPEGRMIFYRNTLQLASAAPWLGMGQGNYDTVFPIASAAHEPELPLDPRYTPLHPESTALMVLAESGLSSIMPSLLLLAWVLRSTGPWFGKKSKDRSRRNDRRLRNSAAIGVLLGVLHSVFDVSLINMTFFAIISLLAGVALRPRRLPLPASILDKSLSAVSGLAVIAAGAAWMLLSFGNLVFPGNSAARMLSLKARDLANSGAVADALPLIDRAVSMRPLDFRLYFERAEIRLMLRLDYDAALLDFTRARVLQPYFAYHCYNEGLRWLSTPRPENAILGWREFLRRFPAAGPGVHGYYRQMINHAMNYPDLREQVWKLSSGKLDLQLDYLSSISSREDFDRCLREILSRSPDLATLESSQRVALFDLWSRLGDHDALMAAIESNKTWERDGGWKLLASHYAKKSDFKHACEIALIYLPSLIRTTPGTSTDVQALERAFLFNALDARLGIDLFQAYKSRNEFDMAIRTLEKVRHATHPPPYINQEIAALYIAKEDFRRAWEHFSEAMKQPLNLH